MPYLIVVCSSEFLYLPRQLDFNKLPVCARLFNAVIQLLTYGSETIQSKYKKNFYWYC